MKNSTSRKPMKALDLIQDGTIISLGGGSSVAGLARNIKDAGRNVTIVSPSKATEELCEQLGLNIVPLDSVQSVMLAFDGCDQVDLQGNALKSKGGIHVEEKLAADKASRFYILTRPEKIEKTLNFPEPIVLEVDPERKETATRKAADVLKEYGITDLSIQERPAEECPEDKVLTEIIINNPEQVNPADLKSIAQILDQIEGLKGHSLFAGMVDGILMTRGEDTYLVDLAGNKN